MLHIILDKWVIESKRKICILNGTIVKLEIKLFKISNFYSIDVYNNIIIYNNVFFAWNSQHRDAIERIASIATTSKWDGILCRSGEVQVFLNSILIHNRFHLLHDVDNRRNILYGVRATHMCDVSDHQVTNL